MFAQKTLFNQVLKLPKTKKELDAVCCESCYTASEPKCDCRCRGAFHGLGNLNKQQLPECQPLDRSEKIIDSLKNAGEVFL
jgi:hypothetical protein